MKRLLKERLKFFGEIVGALLIDAAFLSAWALIDHGAGLLINYLTSGQTPIYILLPKYVLDYSPPLVIAFFVLVDVVRALKKLFDLLLKALRGERDKGHGKDKEKGPVNTEADAEVGQKK
jgi:hypothetical protein